MAFAITSFCIRRFRFIIILSVDCSGKKEEGGSNEKDAVL